MTVATEGPAATGPPRPLWGPADAVTALRIPLAAAFVLFDGTTARFSILGAAAVTDLADGWIARWKGSSRAGPVFDPVVDKLFTVTAVLAVVSTRGGVALGGWEIVGVLLRDLAVLGGIVASMLLRRRLMFPARVSGKVVTVLQFATLAAILLETPYLRPLAWATAAASVWTVADYTRAALRMLRG